MEPINIKQRSIGINFTATGEAEVIIWAPFAEQAVISLEGGNSTMPLHKKEYGYWQLTTNDIQPGAIYKFILDDEDTFPDPASLVQPEGVHGPSQAFDTSAFQWADILWNNIPLENYIIYELHTGTFTPEGTFAAIEQMLDYLVYLGITAIEIMPVAQFPGSRNWGYDGVYPFAVQNSYGGPESLQHLVNVCHNKGLAVILDVVYNHLGPEGNYFNAFGPYFTDKYCTPWGKAINLDDTGCDAVRRFIIENVLMWFRDFHIDALRMDAVHALKDFSAKHILQEIREYTDQLMRLTGRTHYLLIECDLNDSRFIRSTGNGGYGMDAQWTDEFHHALRVSAGGERNGYYSDFNGIEHLAKAYRDAYVYDGIYSEHRQRTFGNKATGHPGKQFIVFSQNHDQVGNRMLGERTSRLVSFEMQKLLAAAVLTSPYLPLLFMGEEYSETNPFLYFAAYTDPEVAEMVRKGRKEEFAAFHGEGEAPDPLSEEVFLASKLQWRLKEEGSHKTMLHYYRTLIAIRKELPVLKHLDRDQLEAKCNKEAKMLLLHRWHEEQHTICLMNFSRQLQQTALPAYTGRWRKLLDSADSRWNGPGSAPDIVPAKSTITLQPESFLLYA
ncbi:MAG TPA: malto-oligosyltrehalose trehalohydrolase [Chitinophagaceae bacterium]|nr:malto-oligosyltrehalose trehalohydrolase [Chitinophagaceae bacterium]